MTFKGCFKDKLQFSRTKIYFTNRQPLTSFWKPYLLKHSILTFSAMVDHIILFYFPQQHFAKWLGMTCKKLLQISFKHKIFFNVTCQFYRFWHIWYTRDKPNFPRQNNIILQKMVSGIENEWISRTFHYLIKKSSTFQGPWLNSRTFLRWLLNYKIQDLFKIVRTMHGDRR